MEANENIPEGETIIPYLILEGADKFKVFMERVFNAKDITEHLREDQTILHGELIVGNSKVMFAECSEEWQALSAGMFVYVANADETYRKALENGSISLQEPCDQSYGRACGVQDPFGNTWWITSALG